MNGKTMETIKRSVVAGALGGEGHEKAEPRGRVRTWNHDVGSPVVQ